MTARELFAGASASVEANYIEDVFSTYLYSGNETSRTITNGIDLSTKGGLVWTKARNTAEIHNLYDTARGAGKMLYTNSTASEVTRSTTLTSFTTSGYTLGIDGNYEINSAATNYVSWTFRKQAKFFDIVTWTGNGATIRYIPHSLASTPGMVVVKRTDAVSDWSVVHRSFFQGGSYGLTGGKLNSTAAFGGTENDETGITWTANNLIAYNASGSNFYNVNASGATYVAYLFAHDAGGFGAAGTDSVVACGGFTEPASGYVDVTLGWEPQYILFKPTNTTGNWFCMDTMRGFANSYAAYLYPNTSGAEVSGAYDYVIPTATGFKYKAGFFNNGASFIYLAIRRGPMKTPTDATKVFSPNATSATVGTAITTGFPVDLQLLSQTGFSNKLSVDRLRGVSTNTTDYSASLYTSQTYAETTDNRALQWTNTGFSVATAWSGSPSIYWNFRRAPGFFDVVCYTGTGSATTVAHNLGVAPELMIVKQRNSGTRGFLVYSNFTGNSKALVLNDTVDTTYFGTTSVTWNSTSPTSASFSVGTFTWVNDASGNYVAYLFATCPGVSKVGSYTGSGTTKQIDCGFASGARFVLIKRTDSTGDWYLWDTARGIVSGNDPYLLLNSTAAEDTSTDYIDPYSAGFEISSTAPAAINASGGTFIYLAIA